MSHPPTLSSSALASSDKSPPDTAEMVRIFNRFGFAVALASSLTMAKTITPLDKNWSFSNANSSDFRSVAKVPSEIFIDLLDHKLIPDPFDKKNELAVQWVGEENWVYKTEFDSPKAGGNEATEIVLEGLDTFATVTINGKELLKSDNMFIPHRVDISKLLKKDGGRNQLSILFESAFIRGRKIQEQHPEHQWLLWNGDASRLVVRKAQYHYGWDWGPMLMTSGPWKPIYLETYTSRIDELFYTADISTDLSKATVTANAVVVGFNTDLKFTLTTPDGKTAGTAKAVVKDGKATATFSLDNPQLWYPHGYGKQPLYILTAVLGNNDKATKRIGLRRAIVQQKPLENQEGLSFFFEINNVPIWSAGSNWIPADSFLTRVTEDKYRKWLTMVRDGRQNMVRVWGGGVYEQDVFYDIADELGLMVWQDFMFGCGNYPAGIQEFRDSVKAEVIANVKRLRHHPSIVLFAGNNEDYTLMWGSPNRLGYNANDTNPDNWLKTDFPARYIYEKILPEAVAAYAPASVYHPGCPWGNPDRPDGGIMTLGDTHQWNVWHGTQEPYQNWDKLAGRFVSEFGMEAFPHIKTIASYHPPSLTAFDETIEFHNKATGADRRIALYMAENFVFDHRPLEAYIYSTQLMQSEALSAAYRAWRRNWQGPGKEYTSGALVWQINDCWPVTSWSIVDYYFRPKAAYYSIKRELAPVTIGSKRIVIKTPENKYSNAHMKTDNKIEVWVSSFNLKEDQGPFKLVAKSFDVTTGEMLESATLNPGFAMPANRAIELANATIPGLNDKGKQNTEVVTALYILDKNGQHVARSVSWPDPMKYVKVSATPKINVLLWQGKLKLMSDKPVKGVVVEADGLEVEDNAVDLVPGEVAEIGVKGSVKGVVVRHYGAETGRTVAVLGQANF